jgi:hypothetical protein
MTAFSAIGPNQQPPGPEVVPPRPPRPEVGPDPTQQPEIPQPTEPDLQPLPPDLPPTPQPDVTPTTPDIPPTMQEAQGGGPATLYR